MPAMLPLTGSIPDYRVGTTLDGVAYILDVRWNYRDEAWYFDLLTADEEVIRAGIKITLGAFLGARSADARMPPGYLIASDLSNSNRDATLDDLGTRVVVHYFAAAEI